MGFMVVTLLLLLLFVFPSPVMASHSPEDVDGDGIPASIDNCPTVFNPYNDYMSSNYLGLRLPQPDRDNDGVGNACDLDVGDGIPNRPDPGYSRYDTGLGIYFVDAAGEPIRDAVDIFFDVYLDYPSDRGTGRTSPAENIMTWEYLIISSYSTSHGNPASKTIRIVCEGGGTYDHTFIHPRFEMVALGLDCQPREDLLWSERDDDHDGVRNGVDQCPLEFGYAPSGCPDECTIRRLHTAKFRAYISVLTVENDLYAFEPRILYCYSDTKAEILNATIDGTADSGFAEGVLDLLGFTPRYRSDIGGSQISPDKTQVYLKGRFDMCFDFAVLVDKLGIKSYLEDKAQSILSKKIAKELIKNGGDTTGPKFANKLLGWVDEEGQELLNKTAVISGRVPWPLGGYLENKVMEELRPKKAAWDESIRVALQNGAYSGLAADQIASLIVATIKDQFNLSTTVCFEVWEPLYSLTVKPGGSLSSESIDVFTNPFVSVEQME
jgi:hypothetical protein